MCRLPSAALSSPLCSALCALRVLCGELDPTNHDQLRLGRPARCDDQGRCTAEGAEDAEVRTEETVRFLVAFRRGRAGRSAVGEGVMCRALAWSSTASRPSTSTRPSMFQGFIQVPAVIF